MRTVLPKFGGVIIYEHPNPKIHKDNELLIQVAKGGGKVYNTQPDHSVRYLQKDELVLGHGFESIRDEHRTLTGNIAARNFTDQHFTERFSGSAFQKHNIERLTDELGYNVTVDDSLGFEQNVFTLSERSQALLKDAFISLLLAFGPNDPKLQQAKETILQGKVSVTFPVEVENVLYKVSAE